MERDGKTQLQWRTATCSNPGGYVPLKVSARASLDLAHDRSVDQVLPSKIADDVPHFLHFLDSRPKPAAESNDARPVADEPPHSPTSQSAFASLRNKLPGLHGRRKSKDSTGSA